MNWLWVQGMTRSRPESNGRSRGKRRNVSASVLPPAFWAAPAHRAKDPSMLEGRVSCFPCIPQISTCKRLILVECSDICNLIKDGEDGP
ncbi:hypothetical protein B296_00033378 [Ensete ventricosum]|uniref:Uncharacterized protein n=1 Tax=Ensete ventricosum TaxID=4639 RepID=A0A427AB19_ENSVE|nr:hypothetical protein B296_00033378 [Ensete ventricosum]